MYIQTPNNEMYVKIASTCEIRTIFGAISISLKLIDFSHTQSNLFDQRTKICKMNPPSHCRLIEI